MIWKRTADVLVVALIMIALWVFIGKAKGGDMWLSIALYWAVLTVKNFCDWIYRRRN